jgi:flagellar basal-body rod protein FlgF
MENSIYVGLSRQSALRRELALVANNIANINTTSFKRELGIYSAAPTNTAGSGRLDFVIDHGSSVSFEPGSIKNTGNDFDIAINGPGFITIDDGDGIKYSRNGSLSLSADNQLITRDGDGVVDDGGAPIVIPMDGRKLQIGVDGTISLDNEIIAKIKIVEFESPHLLQKRGDSKFITTEEPKDPTNSSVLQGKLETSNVTAVKELVRMVDIQRSYESITKFLDREADRQKNLIQRLARLNNNA